MEELYNIGIDDETIKGMLEINPEISELTDNDIKDKKDILTNIGCTHNQILNIIGSNPILLSRTHEDIISLINYLENKGFDSLNILFDSNPYILNLEDFEIENYINNRISSGEAIDDIIDDLDSNPILFSEM